ncbi:mannosyltransferase PIG-V [Archangium gephyra]|uniref:Mannosyltransferase PIG-V n=1 Tax=Archangium gephyra TaxID=48 RepID=A0ABX9JYY3_9BACT|nr:mannosyltransferase family protein [Archangium gephyra]REG29656.1 mannosyltransferase PIG-V [Archangium gephyra]
MSPRTAAVRVEMAGRVARPGLRAALGLSALMLVHHFALWAWTAFHRGFPLLQGLERWDSAHYNTIVTQGYVSPLWAFLPLYPLAVVRPVYALLGGAVPPQVLGCVLSTALLLAFVVWVRRWDASRETASPLAPRTVWGWFFFLFSPASFALHSHHTEALFLLLSFGAFASAWSGRFGWTALFAGLCVLTRNQGVFVAAVAALLLAERAEPGRKLVRFAGLGAVSLAAYGGLMVFEWLSSGDPLAHLHAQESWSHAGSAWEALRTLWYGNPAQVARGWPLLRGILCALVLVASVALFRQSRPLFLYGVLSVAVMLPQGDFHNAFRFGAVLFPMLFWLGDWVAARPALLRWTVALLTLWLNHRVTHGFVIGLWAY